MRGGVVAAREFHKLQTRFRLTAAQPFKKFATMLNLDNRSSIPTKKILKLIEFCSPKNCKLPKIIVKNCRDKTKMYDCEFRFSTINFPLPEPYIIFRFNNAAIYPMNYQMSRRKIEKFGYLGNYQLKNFSEMLVFTISHEIHHHYLYSKVRHCFYSNLKKAETLADKFAFRKLKKYRELKESGINPF